MTEKVGDDVLGGDELSEQNEFSFFLNFDDPLVCPFLTERYPLVLGILITSSGIFQI